MEELIKTLVGLNMRLVIGPSEVVGQFEVKVILFDKENKPVGARQQLLPVSNHAYMEKVVDCAQYCINELLKNDNARSKENTGNDQVPQS